MNQTLKAPELKIVPYANALYRAAADEFLGCSKEAIAAHGGFCVALSGGNTPRGVYSLIAANTKNSLPWDKVYIFFGDERHVPLSPSLTRCSTTQRKFCFWFRAKRNPESCVRFSSRPDP